jgi:hypothetical protein
VRLEYSVGAAVDAIKPPDEVLARALAALRAMGSAEREALLQQAGVLDEDGRLAARFRPPDSAGGGPETPTATNGGASSEEP